MLNIKKQEYIDELNQRVEDKILNKANAEFLEKLIDKADDLEEVQAIYAMGNTYKRTGFHFDFRKEPACSNIKYLKKNEKLSFVSDKDALTHKLIIGDNYDALRQLSITHRGKIDVIYIDPPYGKDSMGNFADTNYTNAITRDNLLSMLHIRIQLAKDLLSENGVVFCSIDDRNMPYVKCLFDDIFGEINFVCNFIWKKKSSSGTDKMDISTLTEYVLCYKKSFSSSIFKKKEEDLEGYVFEDEYVERRGKYKLNKLDRGTLGYIESLDFEIKDKNGNSTFPNNRDHQENDGWRWRWSKDKVEWGLENGFIVFKETNNGLNVYYKIYEKVDNDDNLYDRQNIQPFGNIIPEEIGGTTTGTNEIKKIFGTAIFSYPKPSSLIKYLISLIDNKNAMVIDFFAGSGTTGQAVLELNKEDGGNRRFILCTNNEKEDGYIAENITSKRLKRVMTGSCYDCTSDFKWLENNSPLGDNLEVTEIAEISPTVSEKNNTPFDVIDESLYDILPFENKEDKINWVCTYFKKTMKKVEKDTEYCGRWGE